MAWTNIPGTDVDQDSPITQTLMTALRDNAQWAWESTWHPYDMAYPGDGNDGLIFDGTVAAASVTSPDFEDGYEYKIVLDNISSPVQLGGFALRVEVFLETGASYSAPVSIGASASVQSPDLAEAVVTWGEVIIPLPRVTRSGHMILPQTITRNSLSGAVSALTGGSGIYVGAAQKLLRARLSYTSGNIQAQGSMKLLRRRDLLS